MPERAITRQFLDHLAIERFLRTAWAILFRVRPFFRASAGQRSPNFVSPLSFYGISVGLVYILQLAVPEPESPTNLFITPQETIHCIAFFSSEWFTTLEPIIAPLLTIPGSFLAWLLIGRGRCSFSRVFNAGLYLGGIWFLLAAVTLYPMMLSAVLFPVLFMQGIYLLMLITAVLLVAAITVNVTKALGTVTRTRPTTAFLGGFLAPSVIIFLVDEYLLWTFCRSGTFAMINDLALR